MQTYKITYKNKHGVECNQTAQGLSNLESLIYSLQKTLNTKIKIA